MDPVQSNPFLAFRRGLPLPAYPSARHRDANLKTLCLMDKLEAVGSARRHSAEVHIDRGNVERFGSTAWSLFYELVDGEDCPDRPHFASTCRWVTLAGLGIFRSNRTGF